MEAVATTKALAELPSIAVLPHGLADPDDVQFSVPVIDFSALTAGSLEERSRLLYELGEVCENWGFFMLKNHGVPESLNKKMIEACDQFFRLPEAKKKRLETSDTLDPVKYVSNYRVGQGNIQQWRESVQVRTHPDFHTLDEPVGFSEVSKEFGRRVREVAKGLMKAISESLRLEGDYIHEALGLEEAVQMVASNFYPPHAQSEQRMGLFAHTDAGFINLLLENAVSGLQVAHNGKWVKADHTKVPNSFYVSVADHLQILTNGKYKSVIHRATLNDKAARISIVIPYNPPYGRVIEPLPELLKKEGELPRYEAMNYREYMKLKQGRRSIVNSK